MYNKNEYDKISKLFLDILKKDDRTKNIIGDVNENVSIPLMM